MKSIPWEGGFAPWDEIENNKLKKNYDANRSIILTNHIEGSVTSTYNFPFRNDVSVTDFMRFANEIYDQQNHTFRLNLEFGIIFVHLETGEYRYFKPFSNEELFQHPIYISRRRDLNRLKLKT